MKLARGLTHIDTTRLLGRGRELVVLLVLAGFFIAGAIAGAAAGSEQLPAGEALIPGDGSIYGYSTYAGLLFSCARYHLFVLLFSTSLLGVLLIPAALAFRGFALACSTAYLTANYPEAGTVVSLLVLGFPALFTVPALFVAAHWGEMFSMRLLAGFMRRPLPPVRRGRDNCALAVALLLFAAAAVECYIVPPLVRLLI